MRKLHLSTEKFRKAYLISHILRQGKGGNSFLNCFLMQYFLVKSSKCPNFFVDLIITNPKFHFNKNIYLKIEKSILEEPGFEPGPLGWEPSILPLNYSPELLL